MDKAWKDERREVYRWVKGKEDLPLVMLARDDGTLTANVGEMDALVRMAWGPTMRKYGEVEQPDDEQFMKAYGRHVKYAPMEVSDLTGTNLRARLKKMSPRTATSVHGWEAKDLKAMHLLVLELPAELLRTVEAVGVWPDCLAEGFISPVPKGEGVEALKLRPLPHEVAIGALGYADDTYNLGEHTRSLQGPLDATELWLHRTWQGVNAKKSGETEEVTIQGVPIPPTNEFRSLGVGIRLAGVPATGPLLQQRPERAGELLSRLHGVQGGTGSWRRLRTSRRATYAGWRREC